MPRVEVGVAIVDRRRLKALSASPSLTGSDIAALLGDASVADLVPATATISHLYFGSEFCEHLFPETDAILSAIDVAARWNLRLVLATPVANDALVARIGAAATILPESADILVNDWGVASFLRAAHPDRCLIAGRQLAKMIKDPRAPSAAWAGLYPSSVGTPGHRRVLARLGIGRIELDVPPFATPELYAISGLELSVWAPYAYVAKGRICKIGSQSQDLPERFAPGRRCHRECLGVVEAGVGAAAAGVVPFARGNTLYYRHSAAMADVVRDALASGHVTRLVLGGV
jgi:hypothetical protein